jgi:ribosomal protein S18 acetylase RimI-like enzyme
VVRVAESVGDGAQSERRIGHVWVGPAPTGEPMAWVWGVEVEPDQRGQGWGRMLMIEAERIGAQLGYDRLGLHVVGGNTTAIALYTSLGYAVASQVMVKSVVRDAHQLSRPAARSCSTSTPEYHSAPACPTVF